MQSSSMISSNSYLQIPDSRATSDNLSLPPLDLEDLPPALPPLVQRPPNRACVLCLLAKDAPPCSRKSLLSCPWLCRPDAPRSFQCKRARCHLLGVCLSFSL